MRLFSNVVDETPEAGRLGFSEMRSLKLAEGDEAGLRFGCLERVAGLR